MIHLPVLKHNYGVFVSHLALIVAFPMRSGVTDKVKTSLHVLNRPKTNTVTHLLANILSV